MTWLIMHNIQFLCCCSPCCNLANVFIELEEFEAAKLGFKYFVTFPICLVNVHNSRATILFDMMRNVSVFFV